MNTLAPESGWSSKFAARTAYMRRSAVRELLKLTNRPDMISFAGGLPAPELLPVNEMAAAVESIMSRSGRAALQYGETQGVADLRDWLAEHFAKDGLPVTHDHIVITSGAQQALDLIGRIFLEPGDKVIVENPTYLALLSAWRPLGAEFLPVATDQEGICLADLRRVLSARPKLLYTIPNFQNPQGITLAATRRGKLVEMLREAGVGIVEDDPYRELRYRGAHLPRLIEMDAGMHAGSDRHTSMESNVIYTGTFSKVLAPGLRIGWLIAEPSVVDRIVRAKQAADLHTSTFNQHLVLEMLRSGSLDRRIPILQKTYGDKCRAMLSALDRHFPPGIEWTRPHGGMFLMVQMPPELDAGKFLALAIEKGVAFVPGEEFHLDGMGRNTFRLNFSHASADKIEEGIRRIGTLLRDFCQPLF